MGKILRVVSLVALSLVLVATVALVSCAEEEKAELMAPDMTLSQYLKGSTADFDAGVINTMSEGGGEGGAKAMMLAMTFPELKCKEYANLTAAQKEAVDQALVAFLDSIEDSIADGEPLETNPAYTTLHELQGMAWFGRWASWGRDVVDAFYMTWPNPTGRGSECEFKDWITQYGLADVTGNDAYVWAGAGAGKKYAEQSAADRATIDADLALFEETMQEDADAAYAAAAAAGAAAGEAAFMAELAANWPAALAAATAAATAAGEAAGEAAFQTELATNWPTAAAAAGAAAAAAGEAAAGAEIQKPEWSAAFAAAYAAGSAANPDPFSAEFRAAFTAELEANWPEAYAAMMAAATAAGEPAFMAELATNWPDALSAATAAATAAGEAAGEQAFQGTLYMSYPDALNAAVAAATAAGIAAGTPAMIAAVKASEAFAVLKMLGKPAADGWKADVTATVPVHPRQAFYRWMAKGAVSAMAAAAPLIRLSVAEFSIKVTNPNEYWISLDSLTVNASIDVDWFGTVIPVDVAKVVLNEKVWVPPMEDDVEGEVTVRLLAPVKVYDVITWGVMAGYDSTKAGGLATFAFDKIQAGTAVWDMTIDAVISAETGTITESYDLQWPTA